MPAKHKTLSIYPDPTARAVVGGNSPACNRAVECWAKAIQGADVSALLRADWNFMADVLNGTMSDANWTTQYLHLEVSDAITLNGTDWKWYGTEAEELATAIAKTTKKKTKVHPRGQRLLETIAAYDYTQVHAVLIAVAWFWEHHEAIDHAKDDWWTPAFRVRHESS